MDDRPDIVVVGGADADRAAVVASLAAAGLGAAAVTALDVDPPAPLPERVEFNRDVRPILSDKCFACHGPDASHRKGKLRLDLRDEALQRDAFVPGRPAPLIAEGVPTLVMVGTADPATPIGNAHRIVEHLADGYLVIEEGGPHVIFGWGHPCPDDIVAVGRHTHNVKIYWNETK